MAIAGLLTSCTSTSLVNQWRAGDYRGGPFQRILVIGISDQEGLRRTFEDVFTIQLRQRGVAATPGYRLLSSTAKADERELLRKVHGAGFQGVLVTRVVAVDTRIYQSPGFLWPNLGFYGHYRYFGAYYAVPRIEQYRVATLETNLWDTATRSLVWSGTNRIMQPRATRTEAMNLSATIIDALERNGLIMGPKPKKGGEEKGANSPSG